MQQHVNVSTTTGVQATNAVLRGVYNWMTIGLCVTAGVAYGVASSPALFNTIFGNQLLFLVLLFAPVGLVFYLSARITKLAPSTAATLFVIYSGLMGTTLSMIFMAYTPVSIFQTFVVCAAMFAAMSVYGYTTKRDLSGMGSFLIMGVFGILIASVINWWLKSEAMEFMVSILGVLIFTGLTAYDTQRIKEMSLTIGQQGEYAAGRVKIHGALSLYLNFLNMFLFLLRFMGAGRD